MLIPIFSLCYYSFTHSDRDQLADISRQYYNRVARVAERADQARSAGADQPDAPQLTFLTPHSGSTDYNQDLSATRRLETSRRKLEEEVERLGTDVIQIEERLGFDRRWQPMDERFQRAQNYIATQKYQRALGKLQRLVIQRLFELHKLNIAQTGTFRLINLPRHTE